MLVVFDDRHEDDGRVLVHNTPHSKAIDGCDSSKFLLEETSPLTMVNKANECWMIEHVNKKNKSFGCRLRKSQDKQKDKYLVSRRQRDEATFWVDVTEDVEDATWWQIIGQQPLPLPFGMFHSNQYCDLYHVYF